MSFTRRVIILRLTYPVLNYLAAAAQPTRLGGLDRTGGDCGRFAVNAACGNQPVDPADEIGMRVGCRRKVRVHDDRAIIAASSRTPS